MSLAVNIQVSESVTPYLFRIHDKLMNRADLHAYIAPKIESLTRDYITAIAPGRHGTATRLGASPTNHLLQAAQAIESGHDADAAWLTLTRVSGLSRAFRSFELIPKNGKKWLTIPAIKSAYGRRAGEFSGLTFIKFREDLAALVKRAKSSGEFVVVFWLKKKVTIPKDRTLLPDDKAYGQAAEHAARDYINDLADDTTGDLS